MTINTTPVVAAFDLDGTLSNGGSVLKWLRDVAGTWPTYLATLRLAGPIFVGALRSGPWADRAKERLFQRLLGGRDAIEVADTSKRFAVAHFKSHGRQRLLERLTWHLRQGHDVVIVSASPQIYVDIVAQELGAAAGLGTRLAVDPRGALTGSYLGKNCRGEEKMRRLSEWIEAHHYAGPPLVYAYGNSRGDRAMLRAAGRPYNVGRLGRLGTLGHFPRLNSETTAPITAGE
ncbi:MAG TPA: HAD-IB family hydrolase [Acidimicrobiales bacterium]|nr:HAD-IB family hydrolase [Acidimicrobiales bacterium]